MKIDRLEDLREIRMRCTKTGTYAHWTLTEARGTPSSTWNLEMDPVGVGNRIFDAALGKLYFRRWLDQSLAALKEAAAKPDRRRLATARAGCRTLTGLRIAPMAEPTKFELPESEILEVWVNLLPDLPRAAASPGDQGACRP